MNLCSTRGLFLLPAALFLITCGCDRASKPTSRSSNASPPKDPPAHTNTAARPSPAAKAPPARTTPNAPAAPAARAAPARAAAATPSAPARAVAATPPSPGKWSGPAAVTGVINGKRATGRLIMYLPAGYSPTGKTRYPLVIALHGWGHSAKMFKKKGDLARWADLHRFVLAVPEMGKTIYETKFYPQSKGRWKIAPGARWVGEVILPHVRKKYAVYQDRAHTGVIGYSTGGRGAVLLAELYPQFAFAGSVSGTYDLMILGPGTGEYGIHKVVYGPRKRYPKRWRLDNCVTPALLDRLKGTRLYIVHGGKDRSVPPSQLQALRKALAERPIVAKFLLIPKAGHNWKLWKGSWKEMFAAAATTFRRAKP